MPKLVFISPNYRLSTDENWPVKMSSIADEIKVVDSQDNEVLVKIIDIYKDIVYGWFFDVADRLNEAPDGFVILMIGIAFLDSHSQLRLGKSSAPPSKDVFYDAFVDIVGPHIEIKTASNISNKNLLLRNAAECLYGNIRSGLFHDLMIRNLIELKQISNAPMEIEWTNQDKVQYIAIDARNFITYLKRYFEEYLEALSKNSNLQSNFVMGWNAILDNSAKKQANSLAWQPYQSPSNTPSSVSYLIQQQNSTIPYTGGTVGNTTQTTLQPFHQAIWILGE